MKTRALIFEKHIQVAFHLYQIVGEIIQKTFQSMCAIITNHPRSDILSRIISEPLIFYSITVIYHSLLRCAFEIIGHDSHRITSVILILPTYLVYSPNVYMAVIMTTVWDYVDMFKVKIFSNEIWYILFLLFSKIMYIIKELISENVLLKFWIPELKAGTGNWNANRCISNARCEVDVFDNTRSQQRKLLR